MSENYNVTFSPLHAEVLFLLKDELAIEGALKMLDVKMRDVKLTDQCAGHEIAGHENAGMK